MKTCNCNTLKMIKEQLLKKKKKKRRVQSWKQLIVVNSKLVDSIKTNRLRIIKNYQRLKMPPT